MLSTITTTTLALSWPPLAALNINVTFRFCNTNKNPFQTTKNFGGTLIPSEHYLKHTLLLLCHRFPPFDPFANFFFIFYNDNLEPINRPPVYTHTYIVPVVAMNKLVETFDGLDH